MFPTKETIEMLRTEYPDGTRVRLVKMDDVQAPPIGTEVRLSVLTALAVSSCIGTMVPVYMSCTARMRWRKSDSCLSNKKGEKKMSKLTNTIRTEVDEDYFMDIADFRDYARSMMFPDPVGIDMSDELNDMVTEAVNSGKTTLEDSFKKLVKRDAKGRID